MSLQFRISSSKNKRPAYKSNTRSLLRASEVPESPALHGAFCEAVEHDGRLCRAELPSSAGDPFCSRHYKEWRELNAKWSKTHKEAERLIVISADVAKQKFYPRGGDIQDYIKWIHNLENDVRQLADSLLMQNLNRGPTPETPGVHTGTPHPDNLLGEKIMILQSPLDPRIPIESLEGMPDDGTILILKHFYLDLCADSIRRLYSIVPDLNDSKSRNDSPSEKAQPVADTGTDILRAWFRIMVLNDSEAATLEHATRSKSINEFLLGCQASQLEMYCDFFEKAWRPHAVQYLRVAICAQNLAAGDIKTTHLIGGTIPSTTEGIRMTKPCWDILYRCFPTGESEQSPSLPLPPPACLTDFAKAYKEKHPNGIMAKGSIQTHYCAWPMPAIKSLGRSGLNFVTWEGHVYRWNAMPFDRPSSANTWQYYMQHFLNSKYPFAMFYLTTFVICAADLDDAEDKTKQLLDEMDDHGWKANLPRVNEWTSDVDDLKLEKLFNGVRPA